MLVRHKRASDVGRACTRDGVKHQLMDDAFCFVRLGGARWGGRSLLNSCRSVPAEPTNYIKVVLVPLSLPDQLSASGRRGSSGDCDGSKHGSSEIVKTNLCLSSLQATPRVVYMRGGSRAYRVHAMPISRPSPKIRVA